MKISMDYILKMGHSHELLEDAVITGTNPFPYIIVSDGCSSSEQTHLGSHLLSRSAEIELLKTHTINWESVIFRARSMAESMGLKDSALDATLLIAYIKNDKIIVSLYGDGCLLYQLKNGEKHSYSIEFEENMPYYPSYLLDENRSESYYDYLINKSNNCEGIIFKKIHCLHDDVYSITSLSYFEVFEIELDIEDVNYLILSTDGIESFNYPNQSNPFSNKIFEGLHNFKNFNGDFLKRRMNRIIKEEKQLGSLHQDDLGMAAFAMIGGDE